MQKTLYRGGDVYSPADPFATAMLVDGENVAWVGSDEAAGAMADADTDVVDLNESLITPAFVDAGMVPAGPVAGLPSGYADHGIAAAHLAVAPDDLAGIADVLGAASADFPIYAVGHAADESVAAEWKARNQALVGLIGEPDDAAAVSEHVESATQAKLQARFRVGDDDEMATVIAGFERARSTLGNARLAAAGHRIDLMYDADDGVAEKINALRLSATVSPRANRTPVGTLMATGVPVAFGGAADPWGTVRAAVFSPSESERISARAAFTAHTRGGWRVAGRPGDGALVPGAPATYAIWAPTDLLVQVADERIAAWSTDPRSGTPGLPDLANPEFRPTCLTTVRRGERIHSATEGTQ